MAGPWYVRSTNETSGDGTSWAQAVKTLNAAFALASAGETILVSHVHAESATDTSGTYLVLSSPGTVQLPCKVICVNDSTGELATTATITTTVNYGISFTSVKFVYFYGISFIAAVDGLSHIDILPTAPTGIIFDHCGLFIASSNGGARIRAGGYATTTDDAFIRFIDSIIGFNQEAQCLIPGCKIEFIGGSVGAYAAVYPTSLFGGLAGYRGRVYANGFDFSALGSGKNLINPTVSHQCLYQFSNCKLNADVSILSTAIEGPGGVEAYLDQCMSGDPSSGPFSAAYTYQGSVITDTAIVRTGGASDGTAYSMKMTANAAGVSFISPLITRPIFKVAGTTGSAVTVTAHIAMEEGATPLTEGQCWMEVEYMGTAGSSMTSFVDDNGTSTALALDTDNQTTSTETWTGFTGTPVKQQLSCTFTPAEKGYYMVRIYLARPAAETTAPPVYVCPKLVVS